jgi:ACS family tartrate transporter-like MFS transporter
LRPESGGRLCSLPASYIWHPAAAAGIAWINSLGNLGGFVGPALVGSIKQATGSYAGAVTVLGYALVIPAVLAIILRPGLKTTERDFPARSGLNK